MTDQQPVSTIGAYGNKIIKTPNLDHLAAEGVRFNRFYIAAFACSPSRASFFTGRYSHNHGVIENDILLDEKIPSLGTILSSAGYATGYVGKWHLGGHMYRGLESRKPFDGRWYHKRTPNEKKYTFEKVEGGAGEDAPQAGFANWVGGWEDYRAYLRKAGFEKEVATSAVGNHNDLPSGPEGKHIFSKLPAEHHVASFLAQRASTFLKRQKTSDRPFALVVSFYGPHLPVAPPKLWDEMYPLSKIPLPANHQDDLKGKPIGQRTHLRCRKSPEWKDDQFRDYIRRYWGYCSFLDKQIGRILAALDESGRAQDTIVLFTTDHGDMIGAHGFVYKLGTCGYDELLRVPFLLRSPGQLEGGTVCDELISSVDTFPTVLAMMGVAAPQGIDGRNFLPAATGRTKEHREVVFCNSAGRNLTAVTQRWKYVLNWNPRDLDELYDVHADPGEMKNLAYEKTYAKVVDQMRGRISKWLTETGHPYAQTIVAAMAKEPDRRVIDLWPEVTQFKYLGGNEFEYRYVWHAEDTPPKDIKYWSYTHFNNKRYGKDGDIVFRHTGWPEPPTTQWQAGKNYRMVPVQMRIPADAGSGRYKVQIGLYNPEKKTGPGMLIRGHGSAVPVGKLTIKRAGEKIKNITFQKSKKPPAR